MTCIVGVEKNDKVYMAGDIQGTSGNNKLVHTQPKVFKIGDIVIGYAGSYRFGQIIEAHLSDPFIPSKNHSIYKWLVKVIVPEIAQILEDNGYYGEDEESDAITGGNCLIGVRNELWELQEDFSILRSTRGYQSIGSGHEYALAATEALRDQFKTPNPLLQKVMGIVNTHCPSGGNKAVRKHT